MISKYARAIRLCAPALALKSMKLNRTGVDSDAVEVDGRVIFKFPKNPYAVRGIQQEIALLALLSTELPVPRPLFIGRAECVFFGYNLIPGRPLDTQVVLSLPRIPEQLGTFFQRLHRIPHENVSFLTAGGPDEWREACRQTMADIEHTIFALLPQRTQDLIMSVAEKFLKSENQFTMSLIHADLAPGHILADSYGLTGVIDWMDARWGDPAVDIGMLYYHYGNEMIEAMRESYGQRDENFWNRARLYARFIPCTYLLAKIRSDENPTIEQRVAEIKRLFSVENEAVIRQLAQTL